MKPTRVLHVFGRLGRGGAPLRTLELLHHLDRRRYEIHFCTLSDIVGDFRREIESVGGSVVTLRYGTVGFSRRFIGLLRSERFDVVHSHIFYHSGNILRLARRAAVPVRVAHFRSSSDGRRRTLARRVQQAILRRWIDRHATDILAVSNEAMCKAWKTDWSGDPRCRVLYNGLDTRPFAQAAHRAAVLEEFGLPGNTFLCIHVGRMTPAKNHLRLMEIFAAVCRQFPTASLLLAGLPEERIEENAHRRAGELGIAERVRFCGERSDIPRLLKAADFMLFPSLWEGLPGAILEASAAGIPVVASDLPSIREMASRLADVAVVSLRESDEVWAQRVSSVLASRPAGDGGGVLRPPFPEDVFGIQNCVKAMCSIWDGRQTGSLVGG